MTECKSELGNDIYIPLVLRKKLQSVMCCDMLAAQLVAREFPRQHTDLTACYEAIAIAEKSNNRHVAFVVASEVAADKQLVFLFVEAAYAAIGFEQRLLRHAIEGMGLQACHVSLCMRVEDAQSVLRTVPAYRFSSCIDLHPADDCGVVRATYKLMACDQGNLFPKSNTPTAKAQLRDENLYPETANR